MLRWIGDCLDSSIGKKAVMAVTGLALVGYLFVHLWGNLQLYVGDTAFDDYVGKLKDWGILLYVAEIGLALIFVGHIYLGVRVGMENREARKQGYVVRSTRGKATVSSMTMLVTGLVVLAFLIKHILDFRFGAGFADAPAASTRALLTTPIHALVYLVGVVALSFHLAHAFKSACQTLGVNHPNVTPLLEKASLALAILLGLGFASFPIYYAFVGGAQ